MDCNYSSTKLSQFFATRAKLELRAKNSGLTRLDYEKVIAL